MCLAFCFRIRRRLYMINTMLDAKIIREQPDRVKEYIKTKNADPKLVDNFLDLDKKWRELTALLDNLRAGQKKLSENRDIDGARKNKEEIKSLEAQLPDVEKERELVWAQIPNLPDADVPVGKDEKGNKVLRKWGEPKKFDFKLLDHMELGTKLGLIDTEKAAKVSGARFGYFMREAALLEFAIVEHALGVLTDEKILKTLAEKITKGYSAKPFVPVIPPVMIRPEVFRRMGRLDPGQEEERYYLPKDDLYLVGSAEHTLGPLHMDETIPEENLPLRYVGFSTSFRREAGSYGKDTRGMLRVHQFDKIEIESFTAPENSRKEQDFIVSIQEYLMQSLELPYLVVAICTGDMGGPDARQIDIETWLPGQGKYRETHTSDMMTDYQSRRLGTKVRRAGPSAALGAGGKTEFVHMNDATVFAIGRILIAIMENYQTKEGKINVPKVLQKYLGKKVIG